MAPGHQPTVIGASHELASGPIPAPHAYMPPSGREPDGIGPYAAEHDSRPGRASRAGPPRRQRQIRRSRQRVVVLGAALAGVAVFAFMTDGGRLARATDLPLPPVDDLAQNVGLGLDQVSISGHRFTPDGDIFDAIDLRSNRLLPGFDGGAARRRIEALPWVESADLTRVLPGRLEVRITERKAFAVWRRSDGDVLIDRTGRVLQRIREGSVGNLPLVIGDGAGGEAADLMALVTRHAALADGFQAAERVGGRRWRLRLTGGTRIELPADGQALVLERLAASGELATLLAGGPQTIDLRARGRVAVSAARAEPRRLGLAIGAAQTNGGGTP
ncbi:MAG: FtsQ-type POTRA domain-containing protein [Hyphomicrobiaceae bacterium]|nr:FtsQ-type POTRA domain-containing protein [Hyphomicrobiaceae bacterium]